MIVPDLDLLIYAYSAGSEFHQGARDWWGELVNGTETVGLPWVVTTAFVRSMTAAKPLRIPATPEAAMGYVRQWFQFPHITPINPGADHLTLFRQNLTAAGVGGNLVTDAHIDLKDISLFDVFTQVGQEYGVGT